MTPGAQTSSGVWESSGGTGPGPGAGVEVGVEGE